MRPRANFNYYFRMNTMGKCSVSSVTAFHVNFIKKNFVREALFTISAPFRSSGDLRQSLVAWGIFPPMALSL